jgi:hypothetical protein
MASGPDSLDLSGTITIDFTDYGDPVYHFRRPWLMALVWHSQGNDQTTVPHGMIQAIGGDRNIGELTL